MTEFLNVYFFMFIVFGLSQSKQIIADQEKQQFEISKLRTTYDPDFTKHYKGSYSIFPRTWDSESGLSNIQEFESELGFQ